MPFVFWGGTEAETEFREDVMTVHRNSGYTGSYPKARIEEVWAQLRVWCKDSPTACGVLDFIDRAEVDVHVVGMSGGFQCFGSAQGLDHQKGVIFVDLDAKVRITANTQHNLHLPLDTMARLWKGSQGGVTRVDLDNRVTLLHEVGHSKQWIEKPGWFDKDYRTATKIGIGDDAPQTKDVSAREIREKARLMHLRTAIKTYPAGKPADLSFLPPDEREKGDTKKPMQKLVEPVVWGVPIEHDNMRRHEWPICRELGLPLRSNYGDMQDGGSTKNRQLTSLMKRWIEEEERELAAKNAARVERPATACPVCGVDFKSRVKLGTHFNQSGHRM